MSKPNIDRRLLGTWKSDRRRTFKDHVFKPGVSAQAMHKLKALFGKLTIWWGHRRFRTEMDGVKSSGEYEVIARDASSVVVRYVDTLLGERIQQIHFEGKHYWIHVHGNLREFFRRVE
jgi:hypothetical protein